VENNMHKMRENAWTIRFCNT